MQKSAMKVSSGKNTVVGKSEVQVIVIRSHEMYHGRMIPCIRQMISDHSSSDFNGIKEAAWRVCGAEATSISVSHKKSTGKQKMCEARV